MKILGEKIFAKNADGELLSRIGTMFFKTPGLVTQKGVHAMQRMMWIDELNAERAAQGKPPLTASEEEAEMAESVDLIFTKNHVLIRPDPNRMDLAMRADEVLQTMVSKLSIRYLNTHAAKVRKTLMERGENWRMARQPISQEDMAQRILSSKVAIGEMPIYYYNRATGTRYITASGYDEISHLPADAFRRQIKEVVTSLSKRNRHGYPEVDVFPTTTPPEIRKALKTLKVDELNDADLKQICHDIDQEWRMSLPADLREETVENFEWRNTMCDAITRQPNETSAEEQELIVGISPEFYRQIEWLPGARVVNGEVIFDEIYDEAARTGDLELKALCDNRVKSFLFNATRLFGTLAYINIGRISRSLARRPVEGNRRGNVYIMQYRETYSPDVKIMMIRLQKWGVAERLDEGKDLLRAIVETDEYSDYILDRRLMCRQLGMNLPPRLGYGHFTEWYHGKNEKYEGTAVRTAYFVRSYIQGIASDKVPLAKYRNPAWARKFAELMGAAAAVDMIVGRRSSVTKEALFDKNYEVVRVGADGLPQQILITDHAGSFVEYELDYEQYVDTYAEFVIRRRQYLGEGAGAFARDYVEAFLRRLTQVRDMYIARPAAFDNLFIDRPVDAQGSGAYRWKCALSRLRNCDPLAVAKKLEQAIGC